MKDVLFVIKLQDHNLKKPANFLIEFIYDCVLLF